MTSPIQNLDQKPTTHFSHRKSASKGQDKTRQLLDECAKYLKQNQVKPNYLMAFMGLILCILSLVSQQSFHLIMIGLFILLWALYLKPRLFSHHSPNNLIYWLYARSFNPSVNIAKQIDFTLKFARALDGYSSPFKHLNGRFYLAQQVLSDYFLLQFNPVELAKRSTQGKHQDYVTKALNAVVLLNTLIALVEAQNSQQQICWPQAYRKPLIQLIKTQQPIAIASLLSNYYPQLFQK